MRIDNTTFTASARTAKPVSGLLVPPYWYHQARLLAGPPFVRQSQALTVYRIQGGQC